MLQNEVKPESNFNPIPLFLIAIGVFGIIYVIFLVRSYYLSRKDASYFAAMQAKQQEKLARREKRLSAIYNISANTPLVRGYLRKIEHAYLGICPYDAPYLVKVAAESLALTLIISVIAVLLIISFNLALENCVSLYSIACCLLAIYVSGVECTNYRLKKTENRIMEDMIRYISAVKHAYVSCRDIPVAVSQAAEGLGHEVNRQALTLHDILSGTERKEKVREYALAPTTNKYMKLFVEQAYEVSESGDIIGADSESLFTKNLEFLRVEMKRDMYQKEKRLFRLEGYVFVCLFPIFFMTPMKNWGVGLAGDMKSFYDGAGQFVVLLSFFVTVTIYDAINRAKEVVFQRGGGKGSGFDRLPSHHAIRRLMERIELGQGKKVEKIKKMLRETGGRQSFGSFVMTMLLYVVFVTTAVTIFFSVMHWQNKELLLTEVNNIDSIVSIATETAKTNIKTHVLSMTKEYLYVDDITLEELQADFSRRMYMPNKEIAKNVALEVMTRITSYKQEHLKWYEFYMALVLGLAAGLIPYIGLKYRYGLLLQGKDDEIRQFQAIILMERLFPNVTCVQILEEMENFARIFKPSLQRCINSYSSGPIFALQELKDAERDSEEFVELVDGFIAVEKVGVAVAFAEVSGNREMTQVIKELDEEKNLSRQRDKTSMLSLIPAVLVVVVYFILPFSLNVLSRLFAMFEMLKGLG